MSHTANETMEPSTTDEQAHSTNRPSSENDDTLPQEVEQTGSTAETQTKDEPRSERKKMEDLMSPTPKRRTGPLIHLDYVQPPWRQLGIKNDQGIFLAQQGLSAQEIADRIGWAITTASTKMSQWKGRKLITGSATKPKPFLHESNLATFQYLFLVKRWNKTSIIERYEFHPNNVDDAFYELKRQHYLEGTAENPTVLVEARVVRSESTGPVFSESGSENDGAIVKPPINDRYELQPKSQSEEDAFIHMKQQLVIEQTTGNPTGMSDWNLVQPESTDKGQMTKGTQANAVVELVSDEQPAGESTQRPNDVPKAISQLTEVGNISFLQQKTPIEELRKQFDLLIQTLEVSGATHYDINIHLNGWK